MVFVENGGTHKDQCHQTVPRKRNNDVDYTIGFQYISGLKIEVERKENGTYYKAGPCGDFS